MNTPLTDCRETDTRVWQKLAAQSMVPLWKRILDIGLIIVAAPVIVPFCLLIAAGIKLCSSGPVLFKQERIGFRGQPFTCLKFRTMVPGADVGVHQGHLANLMKSDEPMIKLDAHGDPRLIRGGLLLRSLGLDELPQLINVLLGEMSLVGPRPCIVYEYERYLPRHRQRCCTLPGLTGLWQVKGKNKTTFEEMINLDLQYVREKSLWLDLWILAMTAPAVILQAIDIKRGGREGSSVPGEVTSRESKRASLREA